MIQHVCESGGLVRIPATGLVSSWPTTATSTTTTRVIPDMQKILYFRALRYYGACTSMKNGLSTPELRASVLLYLLSMAEGT